MNRRFSGCTSLFFFISNISISILLLIFFGASQGHLMGESTPSEPEDGIIHPFKAAEKPIIDGELDDAVWQEQALQKDFVSLMPGPRTPKNKKFTHQKR
jgi:hypothetical protein